MSCDMLRAGEGCLTYGTLVITSHCVLSSVGGGRRSCGVVSSCACVVRWQVVKKIPSQNKNKTQIIGFLSSALPPLWES